MATTTTNNGWTIPTSTDLVTNGATAIAALGNGIDTSTGTGLKAWTSWTPTLTNWSNGNGTWNAYYAVLGKLLFVNARFTVGSTTTKGTGFVLSMPGAYTLKDYTRGVSGTALVANATYGAGDLIGAVRGVSSTTFDVVIATASGTYSQRAVITAAVPAAWSTGDVVQFSLVAEVA